MLYISLDKWKRLALF